MKIEVDTKYTLNLSQKELSLISCALCFVARDSGQAFRDSFIIKEEDFHEREVLDKELDGYCRTI